MKYDLPDFDTLMHLHQNDAKALDQIKKEASEALISGTPESAQRRLRGLQFQIDMELRRSTSDLDGCIRVSEMMQASLAELRTKLQQTFGEDVSLDTFKPREFGSEEVTGGLGSSSKRGGSGRESAKILPFSTCS